MRHVFPIAEIPHKWAHATQGEARNAQGNLYFRGDTIYSYRDSWPLARIHRKANRVLVLTNSARYSVTTAAHQSAVNYAARHLPCAEVPCPLAACPADHQNNLAYFVAEQERALKEAGRAMRGSAVQHRAEYANRQHKAMADYMIFFGIRRKMPALLSFAAAFERARRIENPDPASLDKRERANARRRELKAATEARKHERRNLVEIPCARSDWRLRGAFNYYGHVSGATMLRVNGEQIETSQGARVPLAAAPMVWAMVKRAMRSESGLAPCRIGLSKGPMIGDYPLDRIDADGTLHAGCHTIPYSELASMARQLGLEGAR